jgi:hypothetical protein
MSMYSMPLLSFATLKQVTTRVAGSLPAEHGSPKAKVQQGTSLINAYICCVCSPASDFRSRNNTTYAAA